MIDNGGEANRKVYVQGFSITPEQLARVGTFRVPVSVSQLVDAINTAVDNPQMKKLSAIAVTNWLLAKGFLAKQVSPDGKTRRVPTESGYQIGLSTQVRHGERGEYLAVLYDTNAQQFVLDNLPSVLAEKE